MTFAAQGIVAAGYAVLAQFDGWRSVPRRLASETCRTSTHFSTGGTPVAPRTRASLKSASESADDRRLRVRAQDRQAERFLGQGRHRTPHTQLAGVPLEFEKEQVATAGAGNWERLDPREI